MLIEVLDNVFDEAISNAVIRNITENTPKWYPSRDETIEKDNLSSSYSDTGFLMKSFDIGYPDDNNDIINIKNNVLGDLLLNSYLFKSKYEFKDFQLGRYLWNYYNQSSSGVYHTDSDHDNYFSILFNLHDNDGSTIVDNEVIDSKLGRAILFNSNTKHKGNGPVKSKKRYCLNAVFTADGYRLKNGNNQ
jgi:hypothetical protein